MILPGDWAVALDGVTPDAIICDPPYSGRTHSETVTSQTRYDGSSPAGMGPHGHYEAWNATRIADFVGAWSERCTGWMVCLTDSELIHDWQRAYRACGRYAFAPVPCVIRGMSVRLAGDGPSSWVVYAMCARPRSKEWAVWGTLPGAYVGNACREASGGRGKPDWLMRALVRDYSRPGNLVVDPCAGWGSTLSAALGLGRRALGAEIDPDVAVEGNRRIGLGQQTDMFADHAQDRVIGSEL